MESKSVDRMVSDAYSSTSLRMSLFQLEVAGPCAYGGKTSSIFIPFHDVVKCGERFQGANKGFGVWSGRQFNL